MPHLMQEFHVKTSASVWLFILILFGCVTSRSELLGTAVYEPRPENHPIVVYDVLGDVGRSYVKVGIVHGTGAPAASWSEVTEALKERARAIGADAIVLRQESGDDTHSVVLFGSGGATFGTARSKKKKSCLAIRFTD